MRWIIISCAFVSLLSLHLGAVMRAFLRRMSEALVLDRLGRSHSGRIGGWFELTSSSEVAGQS